MKPLYRIWIAVFLFAAIGASDTGNAETTMGQVKIRVNATYSANSLWSEQEIRNRFDVTRDAFEQACPGVNIVLSELIRIEDPNLQDLDGSLSVESVNAIKTILSRFRSDVRPTIFYVRQAKRPTTDHFSDLLGQAYTLGGPRPLKQFTEYEWNDPVIKLQSALGWDGPSFLDWSRLQEYRPIHGIAIIAQGYSTKAPAIPILGGHEDSVSVDRHELGHVLLNDGSHRNDPKNFMGIGARTHLGQEQCELIRSFHLMEAKRDAAIQNGMQQLCELYHKHNIANRPTYCR